MNVMSKLHRSKKLVAYLLIFLFFFVAIYFFVERTKNHIMKNHTDCESFVQPLTKTKNLFKIRKKSKFNSTFVNNSSNISLQFFNECLHSDETLQPSWFNLEPSACSNDVKLVWLIKSSIVRNSLRTFRRKSQARVHFASSGKARKMKTIFLVGSSGEEEDSNPLLAKESEKFDDILQGDFEDLYSSVTYKVFMGLQFVKEKCPNVVHVLVVDDDSVVLPWNLFPLLTSASDEHFYSGFFINGVGPVREANQQWYVSEQEYSCAKFPPYAAGTLFIMSYKTAVAIYDEGVRYRYMSMDDVMIGGIAQMLHINSTQISHDHHVPCSSLMKSHSSKGSMKNLVVCHSADYRKDQEMYWVEVCHSTTSNSTIADILLLYCADVLNL